MLAENVEEHLTMIDKSIIYKVLCSVNRRIATASEWFRKSCSRVFLWLIGDGLILTVAGLFILCGVLLYWCRWTWFSDWGAEATAAPVTCAPCRWTWFSNLGTEGWRNLIFLVAAAGGFVALYFNWRRIKHDAERLSGDRKRLENETYVKALELFGSEDESIRIGAIYALERIALESMKRYHLPIMDVLCAYVRKQSSTDEKESERVKQDIQEILTVLGRQSEEQRKIEGNRPRIDLRKAHLQAVYLFRLNLDSTFLSRANLKNAALTYCSLKGTYLQMSNLEDADLENADLENADLENADLENANLENANLENANLENANLENANLKNVRGLTQDMLDQAKHEESAEPPDLYGAKCTSTGKQLVWRFPSADKVGK